MKLYKISLVALVLLLIIVAGNVFATEETQEVIVPTRVKIDSPSLTLKSDAITVEYGDEVDLTDQILLGKWDSLELPVIDTTQLGTQTVFFIAKKDINQTKAALDIQVVDNNAPVFERQIESLTLDYNEEVDLLSYFEATDETEVTLTQSDTIDHREPGTKVITISATDTSGNISTRDVSVRVKEKPVPKPVAPPPVVYNPPSSSTGTTTESSTTNKTAMTVVVTGYSTHEAGLSRYTRDGTDLYVDPYVIASDWSVIPHNTWVEIPGYGTYRVADTGGAIKGQKIDIHFQSVAESLAFGRRTMTIYILGN